tara:strand:- start:429 stop:821 length:393 start_codon:yes stop_codon:yes gene_type:complete
MDKTTTWLVRGAAIVVISSGVIVLFSFLKPNLNQFNLSKEEKEKIAIEKAEKRCENFEILTKKRFFEMLKNKQIIKARYSPSFFQLYTKTGKYLLSRKDTAELFLKLVVDDEIPVYGEKTLTKTYNKICR